MDFEPIHVPYRYNEGDTAEQKVIFALGQLGEATAAETVMKLKQANTEEQITETEAADILKNLFDQGLIKAENHEGKPRYNLSKIVKPNAGRTDLNGIEDIL
jgi:predicted transcriptional regulator